MKLELKKIKLGPGSEETTQFTAELFVNDKFAAYCDNAGKGGCTDIRAYEPGQRELVAQAEAYCKAMPPKVYSWGKMDMTLENWVDEEVYKQERKKEVNKALKALDRLTKKTVVIVSRKVMDDFVSGKSHELPYGIIEYPHPFERYSDEARRTIVQRATAQLKEDKYIYNSNLPTI